MNIKKNKASAVAFQTLITEGKIDEAYGAYISPQMRHHNAYSPSDVESLRQGMKENYREYPQKRFDLNCAVADRDLVVLHSRIRMKPEDVGISVVHIFRFENDKIIEMWDVAQPVPEDLPNENGMF